MSRGRTEKFFIYAPSQGPYKGHRLTGINEGYKGEPGKLSLQDFLDFLKEQGVDPVNVALPLGFKTLVKI